MMKSEIVYIILLISMLYVFPACKKNLNPFDLGESLEITLIQKPDSLGSRLMLFCQKGEYDCVNMRMKYTLQTSNSIVINIGENYLEGDSCKSPTSTGLKYPASEGIDLGHLSVGTYSLKISHHGNSGTGNIIVTTEKFVVSLNSEYFVFNYNQTTLNRIPTDAIWGAVYPSTTASIDKALTDTLKFYGAIDYAPMLPVGGYGFGYFVIYQDQSFSLWDFDTINDFLYKINIDSTTLSNISNYFSQTYGAVPHFETGKGFKIPL